jgi:signal peptidase II
VSGLRARRAWAALGLACLVVAADQLTKALVAESIPVGGEERLLPPLLSLVHTRNRGVAFGIDPGGSAVVAVLIAIVLIVLALYFARSLASGPTWIVGGLIFGGAIGNLIDRVRTGSVTDFIKLPLGWPPFNVADASITLGVVLLVLMLLRAERQSEHTSERQSEHTEARVHAL